MEKIRDTEGDVLGYKLGEFYLMKHYTWANNYEWIVNKTGQSHYFSCEFDNAMREGELILVDNFNDGKKMLIELNEER